MKTLLAVKLSLVLLVVSAVSAFAIPFDVSGPAALNVDNSTETIVSLNVGQTGSIVDLNLEVQFTDDYAREVDIFLRHGAINVHVLQGIGDDGYWYTGTIFDDEAAGPVPVDPIDGPYQPLELLSAFDGSELSGLWELILIDFTTYAGDGTDLVSWRIFGDAESPGTGPAPVPEPSTLLLLGSGLLGLGWYGRKRKTS